MFVWWWNVPAEQGMTMMTGQERQRTMVGATLWSWQEGVQGAQWGRLVADEGRGLYDDGGEDPGGGMSRR